MLRRGGGEAQRLGPDHIIAFEDRAGANGERGGADIALDLSLGTDQHGPAANNRALDLSTDDQAAAVNFVGDHVPLLVDRNRATGINDPAGFVFVKSDVNKLQRLVTELARDRHRLAAYLLGLIAVEADDRRAVVRRRHVIFRGRHD